MSEEHVENGVYFLLLYECACTQLYIAQEIDTPVHEEDNNLLQGEFLFIFHLISIT